MRRSVNTKRIRGHPPACTTKGHVAAATVGSSASASFKVSFVMLDFFRPGRYRAGVIEAANKLRFSTILIAAAAGLLGFGVVFFIGALIASFAAGALHIS